MSVSLVPKAIEMARHHLSLHKDETVQQMLPRELNALYEIERCVGTCFTKYPLDVMHRQRSSFNSSRVGREGSLRGGSLRVTITHKRVMHALHALMMKLFISITKIAWRAKCFV